MMCDLNMKVSSTTS